MSKYHDPNIPRGLPLIEKYFFAVGQPLTQTFTVPTGKKAVISSIKLNVMGSPFKKIIDEAKTTSGGKITLDGAGSAPKKNIYMVDSVHEVADGEYDDPNQLEHEWYYTAQHSTDDYARHNPFSGEVWLQDSSHAIPGDGINVFADYRVMDWTFSVNLNSGEWIYELDDLRELLQGWFFDANSGELYFVYQFILGGKFVIDWFLEGANNVVPLKFHVPVLTNLIMDAGDTLQVGFDSVTSWGEGAYIQVEVLGWIVDETEW